MIEALPEAQDPPRGTRVGDMRTCQSPVSRERPAWLGTVPSGCSLLQDTQWIPGEVGVGWNLNQGQTVVEKLNAFHLFALIKKWLKRENGSLCGDYTHLWTEYTAG